jgi:hypothetical protein
MAVVPASAISLFDVIFAKVDGGHPCYSRSYDATHLKAHPRQTVSRIEIDFDPKNPDGVPNVAAKFELGFAFQLKGSHNWYGDGAYCQTKSGYFACYLDADGGEFNLTPQNGALKLDVVNRGGNDSKTNQINVEGEDFGGFGKPDGDDLTFVLTRATRADCDASTQ